MARRKKRRGIKMGGPCATKPSRKRFKKVGVRCYCKTASGAMKFLPKEKCRRK